MVFYCLEGNHIFALRSFVLLTHKPVHIMTPIGHDEPDLVQPSILGGPDPLSSMDLGTFQKKNPHLLSISQICDQDFMVLFSKGKCLVLNELGEQLISGIRTLNNCYVLVPDAEIVFNSIRMPNEDLWHQRMGNASYKKLSIVSKNEVVLRIPKLNKVVNVVYGPC